jgi:branched-chain amino acid aminotransferase
MTRNGEFVSYNGSLLARDALKIPLDDRGFRYGDGIFETIRVIEGIPWHLDRHLRRVARGCEAIYLSIQDRMIEEAIREVLEANHVQNGLVRVSVSRSGGERGYTPRCRDAVVFVESLPVSPLRMMPPLRVVVSSYHRFSPSMVPTSVKVAQGLNATLAGIEAVEHGYDDALLLTSAGVVAELTSSCIFWRRGDRLFTPSSAAGAVDGIVRQLVSEDGHLCVEDGEFPLSHLLESEEAFSTNVTRIVQPIGSISPSLGGPAVTFQGTPSPALEQLYSRIIGGGAT